MEELINEFKFRIDLRLKFLNQKLDIISNDFSQDAKDLLKQIEELKNLKDKF
jgi:hypothetical protein